MTASPIKSVEISEWEPFRLGVTYNYERGNWKSHPIAEADYPLIEAAERAGVLSYLNPNVRRMAEEHFAERTRQKLQP
jgi:hypothetical protein